ncbi:MAG: SIS domain-containing protein [Eubacteriales bacterium]|jgi:D-arabinose 5-phosphate isomerase GutQ|nr:SIS domain-containing protein [Eubacteriales bacterium]
MKPEAARRAQEAFEIEAREVLRAREAMDMEAFGRAVDLLSLAPRIAASGCGHSGIACQHFAHLMCCIERPARFISPAEAVHGASGYLQKGDVMLLVSRGGKTAELLPIADICRRKGAWVIAVTEALTSPLAERADVVLPMQVDRETDRYNSQGTASFAATNAIFDALQAALIEETGYRNEQFALIHPGGAVGERLNR